MKTAAYSIYIKYPRPYPIPPPKLADVCSKHLTEFCVVDIRQDGYSNGQIFHEIQLAIMQSTKYAGVYISVDRRRNVRMGVKPKSTLKSAR